MCYASLNKYILKNTNKIMLWKIIILRLILTLPKVLIKYL